MEFYSNDGFRPIFLYWPYKSRSGDPILMICNLRFTLANQGIEKLEKFLERGKKKKNGHLDSSAIYPSLHNRYIACVYPKYCDYKGGDFPRRTYGFKTRKMFLFTIYGM